MIIIVRVQSLQSAESKALISAELSHMAKAQRLVGVLLLYARVGDPCVVNG